MIDKINLVSAKSSPAFRHPRLSRERHEEKRFDKANVELTRTNLFVNRTMTLMMPLMTFIMNGVSLLIIWVGADLIDGGTDAGRRPDGLHPVFDDDYYVPS